MLLFLVGAVAICGLPPLNGFAGEWLLYNGLFRTLGVNAELGMPVAAVAAVALAMIGALAVACFVKLFGTVFLGSPRCNVTEHSDNTPANMIIPMTVLASGCLFVGLFPILALGILDDAAKTWASLPESVISISAAAPLGWMTPMGLSLLLLIGAIVFVLKRLLPDNLLRKSGTWDCGYARPTARIHITGSSFGQTLVLLFSFILWPITHRTAIRSLFPNAVSYKGVVPDVILDRLVLPVFNLAGRHLPSLRILQQGQTHLYVLYILIIVIILLICGSYGV
jgi:hydrogenase-4 component B